MSFSKIKYKISYKTRINCIILLAWLPLKWRTDKSDFQDWWRSSRLELQAHSISAHKMALIRAFWFKKGQNSRFGIWNISFFFVSCAKRNEPEFPLLLVLLTRAIYESGYIGLWKLETFGPWIRYYIRLFSCPVMTHESWLMSSIVKRISHWVWHTPYDGFHFQIMV